MTSRIKDIATIQTGYQFRSKIEPVQDGPYRVIQPKDIDDCYQLRAVGLDRVSPKRSVEAFLVGLGDVVFLSRGARPHAVAITEDLTNTFVSSYFFLVRPDPKRVQARYLAWAINVPLQPRLATLMQGSHVPQVSIADFGALPLDLPPLDVQARIVTLDDLGRREQHLAAEVARRRAEWVRLSCMRAARQGRQGDAE